MFQPNISNPPDKARQDPDTKYLFICTMRTLNLKSTLLSPGSSRRHDEVIQHRLDLGHQVGDPSNRLHDLGSSVVDQS